jgi:hypothetical protein
MRLARRLPDKEECEPEKSEDRYFYGLLHLGELRMPGGRGGRNGAVVLEVLTGRGLKEGAEVLGRWRKTAP